MKKTAAQQNSPKNRVIRRVPSPLALEKRIIFEGAAMDDAVETVVSKSQADTAAPSAGLLHLAAAGSAVPAALSAAEAAASLTEVDRDCPHLCANSG